MKKFIRVIAIVLCLNMLMACGNTKNNTVHDDVNESTNTEKAVNDISSNAEYTTETEVVVTEIEDNIVKGTRTNPFEYNDYIEICV